MNGIDNGDFFLKYKNEKLFNEKKSVEECFKHFDRDHDNALDMHEFESLLGSLFSFNGNPYHIPKNKIKLVFNHYNTNKNDKLNLNEFENFWFEVVKQALLPRNAFVIVDVQNDFIDGSLALKNCSAKEDGVEVVPVINSVIDSCPFDVVVYSLDWHPSDHCSFLCNVHNRPMSKDSPIKDNIKLYDSVIFEAYPNIEVKLWPAHCIQNSKGAELHPDLKVVDEKTDKLKRKVIIIKKGTRSDIDSYSAFFDNCKLNETTLNEDLKKHNITDLYICGLAADVCVAYTSADGLDLKYRVIYVEDACRGVDAEDIVYQKKRLTGKGAIMINSKQIHNMVAGKDRRPELALAPFFAQKDE